MQRKTRVLQNTSKFPQLRQKYDRDSLYHELEAQFESFCNDAKVQVVPTDQLLVGPIMKLYFDGSFPFEARSGKKHEFPDAISLASLREWAARAGKRMFVVTNDAGVRAACSNDTWLVPLQGIDDWLDRITQRVENAALVKRGHTQLGLLRHSLVDSITANFTSLSIYVSDDAFEEAEVLEVSVNDVRVGHAALVGIEGDSATFQVMAEVRFRARIVYDDPDAIVYAEGERYAFNRLEGDTTDRQVVHAKVVIHLAEAKQASSEIDEVDINDPDDVDVSMEEFIEDRSSRDEGVEDEFNDYLQA